MAIDVAGEKKAMDGSWVIYSTRRLWIFVLAMLIVLDCYFHVYVYYNVLQKSGRIRKYSAERIWRRKNQTAYYKYPLVNGSEASMGADATPTYPRNTSTCVTNTSFDPIFVDSNEPDIERVEEQNSDVAVGGYYAPQDCKAANRVAIIIPYRDRPVSLTILLSSLHQLLKKQQLEYRIFVIEQNGTEKFNKGTLYNIAFLETQRFGSWDCMIFHDVDLVPEDERIPYSCPKQPTHMTTGSDSWGNSNLHRTSFGGVTALTPGQYESVNGYSNLYWDWGVEDDDFYGRLVKNYTVEKYNSSIARYAALAHSTNEGDRKRTLLLTASRLRLRREDLTSTKYNLVNVTQEKLYTHILADVNPKNMPLDPKSLMERLFNYNLKTMYGHEQFKLRSLPQK